MHQDDTHAAYTVVPYTLSSLDDLSFVNVLG